MVDMRVGGFHLLKIASDGNFYLLFGETTSKLVSAKFDPWQSGVYICSEFFGVCSGIDKNG